MGDAPADVGRACNLLATHRADGMYATEFERRIALLCETLPDTVGGNAALRQVVVEAIAELTERLELIEVRERRDRELAVECAAFDATAAGASRLRYEMSHERVLRASLRELRTMQKGRTDPEGAATVAPTEPKPPATGTTVAPTEPKPPTVASTAAPTEPKPPIIGTTVTQTEPRTPAIGTTVAPTEPKAPAVAPTEPKPTNVAPTEPKAPAAAPTEPKLTAVAPTEPKPGSSPAQPRSAHGEIVEPGEARVNDIHSASTGPEVGMPFASTA
jgi:hypothetical protein